MGYQPIRFWPGIQVHWHLNGALWASRGYDILTSSDSGRTWTPITRIPARPVHRLFVRFEPLRRLLRLGVRSYLQLNDRKFMVFSDKNIFLWQQGDPQPTHIGAVQRGRGPLLQGCCSDEEGNCYYGEYSGNPERSEEVNVYVWRSTATDWEVFYSFPPGAIRHVHAVQFDPVSRKVWIATGDHDDECKIGYFEASSSPPQLVTVASGKQMARAVSLLFTHDYVYWGSDAGKYTAVTANHIYRWSRRAGDIQQVAEIGGPVYYSAVDQEGKLFVATVVEGSESEKDRCAHLWMSIDGLNWRDIGQWKKDFYPSLFGFGILSFPQGSFRGPLTYVVGNGVQGGSGTWVLDTSRNGL
jgi:hypothetical protein